MHVSICMVYVREEKSKYVYMYVCMYVYVRTEKSKYVYMYMYCLYTHGESKYVCMVYVCMGKVSTYVWFMYVQRKVSIYGYVWFMYVWRK